MARQWLRRPGNMAASHSAIPAIVRLERSGARPKPSQPKQFNGERLKHLKTNARQDLLAKAYLDMLGQNAPPHVRRVGGDEKRDPVEKAIDDLSGVSRTTVKGSIPADAAAVAVLVARAIESVDGL